MSDHQHKPGTKCVVCDGLDKGLSHEEAMKEAMNQIADTIAKHGIAVGIIEQNEEIGYPPIAHSIGLALKGLHEIVVVGIADIETSGYIVNRYAYQVLAGEIEPGEQRFDDWLNLPFKLVEVDTSIANNYCWQAAEFFQSKGLELPKFLQVEFSDDKGLFKGEEGFNEDLMTILMTEEFFETAPALEEAVKEYIEEHGIKPTFH